MHTLAGILNAAMEKNERRKYGLCAIKYGQKLLVNVLYIIIRIINNVSSKYQSFEKLVFEPGTKVCNFVF